MQVTALEQRIVVKQKKPHMINQHNAANLAQSSLRHQIPMVFVWIRSKSKSGVFHVPVFLVLELREHDRSDVSVYIALCEPGVFVLWLLGSGR